MVVCTESTPAGSACLLAVTPSGFDRAGLDSTHIFILLLTSCSLEKAAALPQQASGGTRGMFFFIFLCG